MRFSIRSGLVLGLLLLCYYGVLFASEADELRERARTMQKEAAALADRGNKGEAERLEKEAVRLLEHAERLELKTKERREKHHQSGIEKEVRHLKERLQDLLTKQRKLKESNASERDLAEVREHIVATERELEAILGRHRERPELPPEFRAQVEKLEVAQRRIHHLRVAAENLKLAEAHDLARQIMEKAEAMERDVREAKEKLAAEIRKFQAEKQRPNEVQELRAEIERLRAEIKELRQKVDKR
jgi:chromosome segregation ATPase